MGNKELDKKTAYNIQYAKDKLKRIPFDVKNEEYDNIKAHAASRCESVNGFIKRAIRETMERDAATASGAVPASPSGDPASTIPGRGMPGAAGGDVS